MTTRRALLSAIPALICAPAIVRASSLMAVKKWNPYATIRILSPASGRGLLIVDHEQDLLPVLDRMLECFSPAEITVEFT